MRGPESVVVIYHMVALFFMQLSFGAHRGGPKLGFTQPMRGCQFKLYHLQWTTLIGLSQSSQKTRFICMIRDVALLYNCHANSLAVGWSSSPFWVRTQFCLCGFFLHMHATCTWSDLFPCTLRLMTSLIPFSPTEHAWKSRENN